MDVNEKIYKKENLYAGYICRLIKNSNGCKVTGVVERETIVNKITDNLYVEIESEERIPLLSGEDINNVDKEETKLYFSLALPCFEEAGYISKEEIIKNKQSLITNSMEICRKKKINDYGRTYKRRI